MKKIFVFVLCAFLAASCHMDIPQAPAANFEPIQQGAGLVTFNNTSVNASAFIWDFGDGSDILNTTENVTEHTYSASADYQVKLIARGDGGSQGKTVKVTVKVEEAAKPPVANFDIKPESNFEAPSIVNFTSTSTGNIQNFEWKVNSTSIAISKDVSYTFQTPGTYKVSLTTTGKGGTNTKTKDVVIISKGVPAPIAKFTVSGSGSVAGFTADFNNASTESETFLWNFDDGTTSTETNPKHAFPKPGIYNVILVATAKSGATSRIAGDVIALSPARISEKYDGNNIASSVTKYNYTDADNLQNYESQGSNNDFTNTQVNTFDAQKRLVKLNYKSIVGGAVRVEGTINYSYNELGQLVKSVSNYKRANNGYQSGDRGTTTYEYGANLLVSKITVDSTIYTYDGTATLTGISFIGNGTGSRTTIDGVVYSGSTTVRGGKRVSYAYSINNAYRTLTYNGNGQLESDVFNDSKLGKKIAEYWTYDDKINPDQMFGKYKGHPAYAQFGFGTNVHNVKNYSKIAVNAGNSQSDTYLFEYNEKNLPTAIRKQNNDQDEKKLFKYIIR